MKKSQVSLVFAATALMAGAVDAQALYTVTPLNQLPTPGGYGNAGRAMNANNEVVGYASDDPSAGTYFATTWTGGNPTVLVQPSGSMSSAATGINNAGQISGVSYLTLFSLYQAVVWSNGTPTLLPQPAGSPAGSSSYAYHINDGGQVVGVSGLGPTIWNGITPTVLTMLSGASTGAAVGINDGGVIVGSVCCFKTSPGVSVNVAVIWHGTTPTALPVPSGTGPRPDSQASAINKSGLVVGQANIRPTGLSTEAVAWINGGITSLGDLGSASAAYAVNDRGIIVGYSKTPSIGMRAVVWSKIGAAPQDLNTLIDPAVLKTLVLNQAVAINNNCSIVADGGYRNSEFPSGFLLTLNDPSKCVNGGL